VLSCREDSYFKQHGKFRDTRTYFSKLKELQAVHGYSFNTVLIMSDDQAIVEDIRRDRRSLGLADDMVIASTDDPYRRMYKQYKANYMMPLELQRKMMDYFVATLYMACTYGDFVIGVFSSTVTRTLRHCMMAKHRLIPANTEANYAGPNEKEEAAGEEEEEGRQEEDDRHPLFAWGWEDHSITPAPYSPCCSEW
jgi:hypothetical protein